MTLTCTTISGVATAQYVIKITRVPRPGYNIGGTSTADAPLLSALPAAVKASVHPYEPRQYWKVNLPAGSTLKVTGQARSPGGAFFFVKVFRPNGLYDGLSTVILPGVGSNGAWTSFQSSTFTNTTGQASDFWVAAEVWSRVAEVQMTIVKDGVLPQLSLFLDVLEEQQFAFDPLNPTTTNDFPTFVPGARQNGLAGGEPRGLSVALPQSIQVIAAYTDAVGNIVTPPSTGTLTFALSNVSAFDGIAMNAPNPPGAPGPDIVATSATSGIAIGSDNTARVTLAVWDYAAIGTITASHGTSQKSIGLPKDDGIGTGVANNLPDAGWELFQYLTEFGFDSLGSVADASAAADDQDNDPLGEKSGDNLIRFEEYRGFFVGLYHHRTSPSRKDVFLYNNTGVQQVDAPNTGIRIYSVMADDVAANRRINFNSTGIAGHVDQQAILAFNVELASSTGLVPCAPVPGSPLVCYPNIIGGLNGSTGFDNWMPSNNVQIDVDRIHRATLPTPNSLPGDPDDLDAERSVFGHEFGHAVGISHNTGNASSIMTPVLNLDSGHPPIPHQFDEIDLAQIELK